jgi:thiol-disulfide isomerase/thioredoxin
MGCERVTRGGGLLAAVALLALLAGCGGAGPQMGGPDPGALPDFRGEDLQGRVWDYERMQGQVVLIDFWATWCGPCIDELPYLKTAYQRHADDGFEIVGVSLDGPDRDAFRDWLDEHDVTWPQIHEGKQFDSRLAREFGVTSIPSSLLIDRSGEVVATNLRGPRLVQAVERAVDGAPS